MRFHPREQKEGQRRMARGTVSARRERRPRLQVELLEDRRLLTSITEFPVPGHPDPSGIVTGADGNLWFLAVNAIEGINPASHKIIGPFTVNPGSLLEGITAGPDGNIWFTDSTTTYNGLTSTTTYQIGMFNPTTHAIQEFTVPSSISGPDRITVGPDNNLWFTAAGSSGAVIGEINPSTHAFNTYAESPNGDLAGITSGPDGNIWFTDEYNDKVGVFSLTSDTVTLYSTPTPYAGPDGITVGPDKNIWFTEGAIPGHAIAVLNLQTDVITEYQLSDSNAGALSIVTGQDGNLWFTEVNSSKIGTINPATHAISEYLTPTSGSGPREITTGPDGNLWFTENYNGAVAVVTLPSTAATHLVVTTQPPGSVAAGNPFGLTVSVENAAGNVVNTFNNSVTASLGANPGGTTLGGTVTVTAQNGLATFSNLLLNQPADGYTINVSSAGLTGATTNAFNVTPTTATQLVVTTPPPGSVSAGATFELIVSAENASGNVVTTDNQSVTVTLGANPGGSALGGTLAVTAQQGVAVFPNLTLNQPGSGYTLELSSQNLSVTTTAFNVTAAATLTQVPTPTSSSMPAGITTAPGGDLWFVEPGANQVASLNPVTDKIAEYPIPTSGSGANEIALGPDGELWINEPNVGKIAQLNPSTGAIVELPLPNGGGLPTDIVADTFGDVLVTDSINNTIEVYNTLIQSFNSTSSPIPTANSGVDEITPGPNGKLWFTETTANKIAQYDPAFGAYDEFTIPTAFSGPTGITEGPDGNIWFLETTANKVASFNPATSQFLEYAIPTVNSDAAGITTGPDGNLWFTEQSAGKIAEINPSTGAMIEYPALPVGSQPVGIATGPDRNIWFTESGTSQLAMLRITTPVAGPTIKEYLTSTAGAGPEGITTGPGGNLYFTEEQANKVAKINAANGAVQEYTIPSPGEQPMSIAPGSDGNLYFTEFGGNNDTIGKLNPTTGAVQEIPAPGLSTEYVSIASGPDGNIWFTDVETNVLEQYNLSTQKFALFTIPFSSSFGTCYPLSLISGPGGDLWFAANYSDEICSFNPTSQHFSNYVIPTSSAYPVGLTVGPDGNLWFTESNTNKIGQLNPSSGAFKEFSIPTASSRPDGITGGPDGDLWFVEQTANQVGQLNPSTGQITEYPLPTPNSSPVAITAGKDGNLWFTEFAASQIGKITPPGAPAMLAVTSEPPSAVTAGNGFGLALVVEDAGGNLVYGYNGNVTLSLGNNPGGSTLGGTVSVAAVHGVATFSGLTLSHPGNGYTLKISSDGLSAATTAFNVVSSSATRLVVTAQPPSDVAAGSPFGLTIAAENSVGDIDHSFSGNIAVAIGYNAGGGTLDGTLISAAKNGIAAFSGLTLSQPGNSYTLNVTAGGLTSTSTLGFNVSSAVATQWVITVPPPESIAAEDGFGLSVAAENASGAVVTTFTGSVSIAIANNPSGATLSGMLTATLNAGLATFSGLALDKPGTGYTLSVSGSGLSATTTGSINVTPGLAVRLAVTQQPPASVSAGEVFGLTVAAEDSTGNVDPNFAGTLQVALDSNPGGASLSGILTVTASNGFASFTNLDITKPGAGYTLEIRDQAGLLTPAVTQPFTVTGAVVSKLAFVMAPASVVTAGSLIVAQVAAEDSAGNIAKSYSGSVTVSLSSNPGGATLGGTLTEPFQSGVAAFGDLTLNRSSNGYILKFTSGSLTSVSTGAIEVDPGQPSQLAITVQPPQSVAAGAAFGMTVAAEDRYGNIASTLNSSMTLSMGSNPNGATLDGTLSAVAQSGIASFSGLSLDKAGAACTISVSAGALKPATSNPVLVTSGSPIQWVIEQQPPSQVSAGTGFSVTAEAEDAYGNLATTFSGFASIYSLTGPSPVGQPTVQVFNGMASFMNLSLDQAGSDYALLVSGGGMQPAVTRGINVAPGAPAQMTLIAAPPSFVQTGSPFGMTMAVLDAFGNRAPSFSGPVTVYLASGTLGASIGGPTTIPANGGVASFSGLTLNQPGSYDLVASAPGVQPTSRIPMTAVQAPSPPQVLSVTPRSSHKGLTSITVMFDQALDIGSALNVKLDAVVQKRRGPVYKQLGILSPYVSAPQSITVRLVKAYRGRVQLTIAPGVKGVYGTATVTPIVEYVY
jgi:streptogramin lyase